ncbi:MAG TPA: hypothetical protein VF765_33880 [Polyangiaceae bacterium]
MARRSPAEILAVLEDQAREDEAVEAQMNALAAMSDAQLDDHLRGLGLDPAQLEREALAMFVDAPGESRGSLPSAVQAVPQEAPRAFAAEPRRRRRPLTVALWLAAGAAAATGGGALVYSLTHPSPEQPAPPAPSPPPTEAPSVPLPPAPVAMTPADERIAAAAAFAQGKPRECLRLLDHAKEVDPAGDAAPDIRALRDRANRAIRDKPPVP